MTKELFFPIYNSSISLQGTVDDAPAGHAWCLWVDHNAQRIRHGLWTKFYPKVGNMEPVNTIQSFRYGRGTSRSQTPELSYVRWVAAVKESVRSVNWKPLNINIAACHQHSLSIFGDEEEYNGSQVWKSWPPRQHNLPWIDNGTSSYIWKIVASTYIYTLKQTPWGE